VATLSSIAATLACHTQRPSHVHAATGSIKGAEAISIAQVLSHKTTPNMLIFMNAGQYMW
jgi:hypothetical protein